jgi:hypothetical protein
MKKLKSRLMVMVLLAFVGYVPTPVHSQPAASRPLYVALSGELGFEVFQFFPAEGTVRAFLSFNYQSGLTLKEVATSTEVEHLVTYLKQRDPNDGRISNAGDVKVATILDALYVSPDGKSILFHLRYQWCLQRGFPCFGTHHLALASAETKSLRVIASIDLHQSNVLPQFCQESFRRFVRDEEVSIRQSRWSGDQGYVVTEVQTNGRQCDSINQRHSLIFVSTTTPSIPQLIGDGNAWYLDSSKHLITLLDHQCSSEKCRDSVEWIQISPRTGEIDSRRIFTLESDIRPFSNTFSAVGNSVLFFGRDTNSGEFPHDGFGIVNASSNPSAADLQRIPFDAPEVPKRFVASADGQSVWAHTVAGTIWKATITDDNKVQYREFYPDVVESFIPSPDGTLLVREAGTRYAVVSTDGVKLHEVDLLQVLTKQADAPATLSEDMIVAVSW